MSRRRQNTADPAKGGSAKAEGEDAAPTTTATATALPTAAAASKIAASSISATSSRCLPSAHTVITYLLILALGALLMHRFGPKMEDIAPQLQRDGSVHRMFNAMSKKLSDLPGAYTCPLDDPHCTSSIQQLRQWWQTSETPWVGLTLKEQEGLSPKHPVIIVPGFITSGLNIWQGSGCGKDYHGRVWTGTKMATTMLWDPDCWLKHLALNITTGRDPDGIKLRSANGLSAVNYFFPGFWVWALMVEELRNIGYDANGITAVPYDWRMSTVRSNERDHYFTKLKAAIEITVGLHNEKAVMIGHSFAAVVIHHFLTWVEKNAYAGWVDKHIEASMTVGGPYLGVAKSVGSLLSGEARESVSLGTVETFLLETFLCTGKRAELWRSWGGAFQMLPVGGSKIWGTTHSNFTADMSRPFLVMRKDPTKENVDDTAGVENGNDDTRDGSDKKWIQNSATASNKTVEETLRLLYDTIAAALPDHDIVKANNITSDTPADAPVNLPFVDGSLDFNPLETPLPNAPNMKIYCQYGVGLDTEAGYVYERQPVTAASDGSDTSGRNETDDSSGSDGGRTSTDPCTEPSGLKIAQDVNMPELGIKGGIMISDGDATVPLISLGYMCTKGWRNNPTLNPGNITTITREYQHHPPALTSPRGPRSGDHVDVIGNKDLIADVLRVVSGKSLGDQIYSDIRKLSDRISLDDVEEKKTQQEEEYEE